MEADPHPRSGGDAAPESPVKTRLESLDLVKGIAILGVIHTHTVFWSGMLYLPDWTRRIVLLMDVPVFFFISGFLLASGSPQGLPKRALRQVRSILLPYLLVGLAALAVSTGARVAAHGAQGFVGLGRSLGTFLRLAPDGPAWELWMVFPGSIWFFRAYLETLPLAVLILATPLRRWLPAWTFIVVAALVLAGTTFVPAGGTIETDSLRVTLGAVLVLLLGATFRARLWEGWSLRSSAVLAGIWVAALLGILLVECPGKALDLTYSKFPPTWTYLLINLLLVQLLLVLAVVERDTGLGRIPASVRRCLGWCGRNSFDLFLVQGLVTSLPLHLVGVLRVRGIPVPAIYGAVLVWNLGLTLAGVWGLGKLRTRWTGTSAASR